MTAPTAVRLTQQLEEVAAVDLTGDAEAPVAALVVSGEVVDGDTVFLPIKGRVSIEEATAEIVAALDRLTAAVAASAIGGTVTIDDTNLPLLVAALGSAVETVQDLADATEATITVEDWHIVGDPGEPAFESSWDTFDLAGVFPPARFYKDPHGTVVVDGLVSGGTPDITAATGVFTLPVGYRPEFVSPFPGKASVDTGTGANGVAAFAVLPSGLVVVSESDEDGALLSASFRAVPA